MQNEAVNKDYGKIMKTEYGGKLKSKIQGIKMLPNGETEEKKN